MSRFIAATAGGFVYVLSVIGLSLTDITQRCSADDNQSPAKSAAHALYAKHVYASPQTTDSSSGKLPYRIMSPPDIKPDRVYPLVLFLHGAGERGDDNQAQLVHAAHEFARSDRRTANPAFVVFPQCPKEKRWVESDWGLESGRGQHDKSPSETMQLALELVDQLSIDYPIDFKRRYVVGLSMGGQGAWFAAANSDRFAAMLEVCGGGDPEFAKQYAGKPIWAFHGQADNVVPVERGREMITALTKAGHAPELRYVEYPEVRHDSWTRTFARDDVYDWLFNQRQP